MQLANLRAHHHQALTGVVVVEGVALLVAVVEGVGEVLGVGLTLALGVVLGVCERYASNERPGS